MPLEFVLEHGVMWTARTHLPIWAGFQDRSGAYGGLNVEAPSDGTVSVMLSSSARDPQPPDAVYHALIDKVMAAEPDISRAVQAALWAAYPVIREEYDEIFGQPPGDRMPPLEAPDEMKSVLGLHTLHILGIEAGGTPYVGYEFGCTWEDEHGLGILMHGTTTADLGNADTAFTLWMAKRHAEANGLEITGPMAELAS